MRMRGRDQRGSQTIEFAAALILLIAFVLIPWIDVAAVLVRWMMANEIVTTESRELAFCETFGQSCKYMFAEPSLAGRLAGIGGVGVESVDMHLRIETVRGTGSGRKPDVLVVTSPRQIPPDWLPNGAKAPCTYFLVVRANLLLSPAILATGIALKIPGLTAPIPLSISSLHEWENLGRNPASGKFFVNE